MAHSSLRVKFDTVFDQTCFNRLATHFNISMFGHQTMFDDVWSPNISLLDRPLNARAQDAKHVLSFVTLRKHRDLSDPSRLPIISAAPESMSSTA